MKDVLILSVLSQLMALIFLIVSMVQTNHLLSIYSAILSVFFILTAILMELRRLIDRATVTPPAKAQG